MHELSLAEGLITQVLEVAKQNDLVKVNKVEIETGVLRQVIPQVMQEAFKAVTQGTLAEKSRLFITEISPKAQCRICNKIFKPKLIDFCCPRCHEADVNIIQGNEIILSSISGKAKK